MPNDRTSLWSLLCALALSGSPALAQDRPAPPTSGDTQPGQGPHAGHKPPEAAYTACEDLSEDDVCQVELRDRTVDGTCVPDHEDGTLFCMPERPEPPPEAAEACTGKAVGDACNMPGRDGQDMPEGVCVQGRNAEELHCRPPMPPADHHS